MSWLSKSVKKLKKSTKKLVKKAVSNPLAIVNPNTYLSGASLGGTAGAAAGKSASSAADLGGTGAVLGGAALSTAGVVGGAELEGVGDAGKSLFEGVSLPRTPAGDVDWSSLFKFGQGVAADFGLGSPEQLDAAASREAAASFNAQATVDDDDELDGQQLALYALGALAALAAVVVVVKAVR